MSGSELVMRIDELGFILAKHLLSLSWQFFLLFAAAVVTAVFLRRTSARIRYTVWMSLFVLIPVVAGMVATAGNIGAPAIEMQVMPGYNASVTMSTVDNPPPPQDSPPAVSNEQKKVTLADSPWAVVFILYSLGVVGFLALVGLGRVRLERWKSRGTVVTDKRILDTFMSAREQLAIKRPFMIIVSDALHAPLTMGTFHPVILIPSGFAAQLSDNDLRAFALHELAHVKRLDSMVLSYVSVMRALFFFNPLVWYAAHRMAMLAETACDDLVVEFERAPLDYADMLVRIARTLPKRELATELAAGFIISKHLFLRRVEQILADRRNLITRLPKWALAVCIAFGLAVVMLVVVVPVGEVQVLESQAGGAASQPAGTVTFRARVIDGATGEPIAGLKMLYYSSVDLTNGIEFVSDRNGMAELPSVKLGAAIFRAEFEKGAGRWWSEDSVQITETTDHGGFQGTIVTTSTGPVTNPLAFPVSEDMEPVTIRIQKTMVLTGTVHDPEGNPVPGATVAPVRTGTGNSITGDTRFSVRTDDNGRYTMYLPDSGGLNYNLVAHDGDYMEFRTWGNGVAESMKSISGERLEGLDITLTRPGSVSGIVVDTDGKPKAGELVKVYPCDGMSNRYYDPEVITDENGRFTLKYIRPGEIWVVSPRINVIHERSRDMWPEDGYRKVTVTDGQTVDNIRLVNYSLEEVREYSQNK